jgi:putative transposase
VVDVFLPKRRDGKAAKRFFNLLLRIHKVELRKIFTDKLRICSVAHREFIPETFHDTTKCVSNRVEPSHEPTRVRERGMRKFKPVEQA